MIYVRINIIINTNIFIRRRVMYAILIQNTVDENKIIPNNNSNYTFL